MRFIRLSNLTLTLLRNKPAGFSRGVRVWFNTEFGTHVCYDLYRIEDDPGLECPEDGWFIFEGEKKFPGWKHIFPGVSKLSIHCIAENLVWLAYEFLFNRKSRAHRKYLGQVRV